MRSKPLLTPGDIFRKLASEFAVRRPPSCGLCKIPLPYAVARPDDVSANWRLGTPRECPENCAAVIAEIAVGLASRFDMSDYAS